MEFRGDVASAAPAEDALRESEAGLLRAQILARLAHVVTGPDGRFEKWSRTLPELTGLPEEQMPRSTRQWLEIVHPADRARFRATAIDASSLGQRKEVEYRLVRPDGKSIHVRQVMEPLGNDGARASRWFSTLQDMTEHRRNEARALGAESRFRFLFHGNPLPMWIHDVGSQRFLEANAAAMAKYGYSREEFLAMSMKDIRVGEDDAKHVTRDGRQVDVEIASHRLDWGGWEAQLVVAVDVTERLRKLEAANRELEAFSYSVSHDLRAPLRHIQGYVELVGAAAGNALPDKARRYLGIIGDAAGDMGRLIDDLLLFSRTARDEMHPAPVPLGPLVSEVMRSLESQHAGRAIEWRVGELPTVMGDTPMLRQVWANLLGNAVKYTRGREPAVIAVEAALEGGMVALHVRDNGVGFDMQHAGRLFGVFQRLHRADEFEGTGIGLAIVQRVVERHGGRIWCEAAVGAGATFSFTLPPQPGTAS